MNGIGYPLLNVRLTMRRALLLLALLAAGFGGGGYDDPIRAVGAPHEITAYTAVSSVAIIRATHTVVLPASENNAGPGPRPAVRRGDGQALTFVAPHHLVGRAASFGARRAEHRHYAAPDAAARAGRLSSPTTAPPPFPLV